MKYIILLAVILIPTILYFSSKLDTQRNDATQRYEECVQREYGTSPMEYYYNQGTMPVCEI